MFETSKDIFNISIAAAIVAVAVFLCWTMYYLIKNLKRINKVTGQIERGVTKVDGLVDLIKSRVKQSGSYIFLFTKLAERAIDYFGSRKKDRSSDESSTEESKTKKKRK